MFRIIKIQLALFALGRMSYRHVFLTDAYERHVSHVEIARQIMHIKKLQNV